jgi:hypothetical protein
MLRLLLQLLDLTRRDTESCVEPKQA